MGRSQGVIIGWMPHSQRTTTLAVRLGYEKRLFGRAGFRRAWTAPLVYPVLAMRTIYALARLRPRAVVVVAPPFVAPIVVVPMARLLRARVAVDIHSGALLDHRWRWSTGILGRLCRVADASIVTLPTLAARLRRFKVEPLVIPDPLPRLSPGPVNTTNDARRLVVAVCGWGQDEPIEALLASAVDRPWQLAITGRPRGVAVLPDNVRLTGFLDDKAYEALLASADLVVVLTNRDETLLSGAWEALSLGRPLIVSATRSLEATFGRDIACIRNDPRSIAAAIEVALDDPGAAARSARVASRFREANDAALNRLRARLGT